MVIQGSYGRVAVSAEPPQGRQKYGRVHVVTDDYDMTYDEFERLSKNIEIVTGYKRDKLLYEFDDTSFEDISQDFTDMEFDCYEIEAIYLTTDAPAVSMHRVQKAINKFKEKHGEN